MIILFRNYYVRVVFSCVFMYHPKSQMSFHKIKNCGQTVDITKILATFFKSAISIKSYEYMNKVGPTHLFQIPSCFLAFPTFWNVASVRESDFTAQMIWRYCAVSHLIIIIIIHAFIKRRNPTCRSKALNNDVAKVTCKANSKYVKIH